MAGRKLRVAACLLVALTIAGTASANPVSYFETQYNTDWAVAGVGGLRGLGTGTVSLSGVAGPVTRAYLYWHGPTNSTDPNVNANVTFQGNAISGTNIGFSQDNYWGYLNSQAYRADVTAFVSGNGNYSVANMIKPSAEINGVTLLVFSNDGNSANNRDLVIFDGNDANFSNPYDTLGWSASLNGINYSSGTANALLCVSDGQTWNDEDVLLNGLTLLAGPHTFEGDTVPDAGGPDNSGLLWDLKTLDITSWLSPGVNDLSLTTNTPVGDALGLIFVGIDLPAGAAPGQVPEPCSMTLLALGGLGLLLRRRRTR